MGACVRVEGNYFENVGTAVMMAYSPEPGAVHLSANHFGSSQVSLQPECYLEPPYDYGLFLDDTEDLPGIISDALLSVRSDLIVPEDMMLKAFPNPFNPGTTISYLVPDEVLTSLVIYDMRGRIIATLVEDIQPGGVQALTWAGKSDNGQSVPTGIYFARLQAGGDTQVRKLTYLK